MNKIINIDNLANYLLYNLIIYSQIFQNKINLKEFNYQLKLFLLPKNLLKNPLF
jgi:hypothetical protein